MSSNVPKEKPFRCILCKHPASTLFQNYGPSVIKLTNCEKCKGIVDKYIEYDVVIVMIDLVVMSQAAQTHILFNTEFKPYWKLFIILLMLEAYCVLKEAIFISIMVGALCGNPRLANTTFLTEPISKVAPESWKENCWAWEHQDNNDTNLFIWEKDFYVSFLAVCCGVAAFLLVTISFNKLLRPKSQVSLKTHLKAFTLANMMFLFTIPMLVWGSPDPNVDNATAHYLLVFGYSFVAFFNVYSVVYDLPEAVTLGILLLSNFSKLYTTFHLTPSIRTHMLYQ